MRPPLLVFLFIWSLFIGITETKCAMKFASVNVDPARRKITPPCDVRDSVHENPNPLDFTRLAKLVEFCPRLFEAASNGKGDNIFCCDMEQAETLIGQLSKAYSILGRCPSCFHNFANLWCQFTCSPNQASFVEITELDTTWKGVVTAFDQAPGYSEDSLLALLDPTAAVKKNGFESNETLKEFLDRPIAVKSVIYKVQDTFIDGLYNSCKDVKFSSSLAINLMCSGGSKACSKEKFLEAIGTKNIDKGIPMNTKFDVTSKNSSGAMNEPTSSCDVGYMNSSSPCSFNDCPMDVITDFTSHNQHSKTDQSCMLWGFYCYTVGLTMASTLVVIAIVVGLHRGFWQRYLKREKSLSTGAIIEQTLMSFCKKFGEFVASGNEKVVLVAGFLIFFILLVGIGSLKFSDDPLELWSSPNAISRIHENEFNNAFKGQYQFVQLTVRSLSSQRYRQLPGPIFDQHIIDHVFHLEDVIRNITTADGRIRLEDICARPMGEEEDCLIMGVTNYFNNDVDLFHYLLEHRDLSYTEYYQQKYNKTPTKTYPTYKFPEPVVVNGEAMDYDYFGPEPDTLPYLVQMTYCMEQPLQVENKVKYSCLGKYGGPALPRFCFGTVENDYTLSLSTTLNIAIQAPKIKEDEIKIREWEKRFIEEMSRPEYSIPNTSLTFLTETSISLEIDNQTEGDLNIFLMSLLYILAYNICGLGKFLVVENNLKSIFVYTKIQIGCSLFLTSMMSCVSGLSVISLYGMVPPKNATLVIAIMCIFNSVQSVYTYVKIYCENRLKFPTRTEVQVMGITTEKVMMTSYCTTLNYITMMFISGALTQISSIRCFSILASLTIAFSFIYQNTVFLALLSLDVKREAAGKAEFLKGYRVRNPENLQIRNHTSIMNEYFIKYSKELMKKVPRILVCILAIVTFVLSCVLANRVTIGFDERIAFTEGGYLAKHFEHMNNNMDVGPQLFFVVEGEIDWHSPNVQNKFCSVSGCDRMSIGSILDYFGQNKNISHLDGPVYNWLNSYLEWIDRSSSCCQVIKNQTEIQCPFSMRDSPACISCMETDWIANQYPKSSLDYKRPSKFYFYRFLKMFLKDKPGAHCPHGGKPSFDGAIDFNPQGRVRRFHMMTTFEKLRIGESMDFIAAMNSANDLAEMMQSNSGENITVYAHSMFFPFYDQYASIIYSQITELLLTLVVTFLIFVFMLGIDIPTAAVAILIEISLILHLVGAMPILGIQLNAVSQTNLIMTFCISLEYIVHIVRDFSMSDKPTSSERARYAIYHMGYIVFQGLSQCLTGSVMLLLFCHSKVITIYYCRCLLSTVFISMIHGLVYLPVFLSFLPEMPQDKESGHRVLAVALQNVADKEQGFRIDASPVHPEVVVKEEQEKLLSGPTLQPEARNIRKAPLCESE